MSESTGHTQACNFMKDNLGVFLRILQIFKNTYFSEHLRTDAKAFLTHTFIGCI